MSAPAAPVVVAKVCKFCEDPALPETDACGPCTEELKRELCELCAQWNHKRPATHGKLCWWCHVEIQGDSL